MRCTGILLALAMGGAQGLNGQAIDSVFVEVYHVQEDSLGSGPPLVTYRIFVDLAVDHTLQMVYGDRRHQLHITTTTEFFNDTVNGAVYAHRLDAGKLNEAPLALDSWLTIAAASNGHWGIPRSMDTDGSILRCPPYPGHAASRANGPLCAADGLLKADTVKEVVAFRFEPGYLGNVRGQVVHTMDGAWAVLGGTKGPTEENIILIGQLTTTGELSFKLNLQIGTPDGGFVRYVASDPAENEFQHDGLTRGKVPGGP